MRSTKVKVTGLRNGKKCSFIWKKGGIFVASIPEDDHILSQIDDEHPAIGGTYYPTKEDPLTAIKVAYVYFDEVLDIKCNGDTPELPSEPGVVY